MHITHITFSYITRTHITLTCVHAFTHRTTLIYMYANIHQQKTHGIVLLTLTNHHTLHMCIRTHAYIRIYIHTCTHTYMHAYTLTYIHTYTYIYYNNNTFLSLFHTHMRRFVCVRRYVCVCVCVCVCMCVIYSVFTTTSVVFIIYQLNIVQHYIYI